MVVMGLLGVHLGYTFSAGLIDYLINFKLATRPLLLLPVGAALLISGDLIFAGSLGGGYFCCQRQLTHSRRIMRMLADDTVIAPGHGPLTTAANERKYNPFLAV